MDIDAFSKAMKALESEAVSTGDPEDLRNVWKMTREVRAKWGDQHVGIDARSYGGVCRPGGNIAAVWFRTSLLGMMAGPLRLLDPWLRDGEPTKSSSAC